jgi:hypothetical protein
MGALREEGRMISAIPRKRDFALFFEEKEGSTAVVQMLAELDEISLVRRETESGLGGWEPFEWFNCGSLGRERFSRCLQLIHGQAPLDLAALNALYLRTARAPLRPFDRSRSVGYKMRIVAPWDIPNLSAASPWRRRQPIEFLTRMLRRLGRDGFRNLMTRTYAEHGVVVFIMARQDIFRWAISKYHGDGTGHPGHMQFRVASGEVGAGKIPKISIDPDRFGRVIEKCARIHDVKRWWADAMQNAGVRVHPLRYEDFLKNRVNFFSELLAKLDITIKPVELESRLSRQIRLQRVHGTDIAEYVENHRQITELYGDRFVRW